MIASPFVALTATPKTALGALLRERAKQEEEAIRIGFPANLTPFERLSVEGYLTLRNQTALGKKLGFSRNTIFTHLKVARAKANVATTEELLALFVKSTAKETP